MMIMEYYRQSKAKRTQALHDEQVCCFPLSQDHSTMSCDKQILAVLIDSLQNTLSEA